MHQHQHLTAHTRPKLRSLADDEASAWLWARLRDAWPLALAASFMPNHLHLIVDGEADEVRRLLASILSGCSRHSGTSIWQPVDKPTAIRGTVELSRQLRYVALNEARAGLASCPLEARWSTHRDVIGAVADPWVTADRLAAALGVRDDAFTAGWHAYVSADPSTDVGGTPMPRALEDTTYTVDELVAAATAALRLPPSAVRSRGAARALFLALASDRGFRDKAALAAAAAAAPRTINRLLAADPPPGLSAARMCLADDRFRRPYPPRRDAPWKLRPTPGRAPSDGLASIA